MQHIKLLTINKQYTWHDILSHTRLLFWVNWIQDFRLNTRWWLHYYSVENIFEALDIFHYFCIWRLFKIISCLIACFKQQNSLHFFTICMYRYVHLRILFKKQYFNDIQLLIMSITIPKHWCWFNNVWNIPISIFTIFCWTVISTEYFSYSMLFQSMKMQPSPAECDCAHFLKLL